MPYLFLSLAIIAEVVSTMALKASDSFTKLAPSIVCIVGYAVAFYLLTVVFRYFSVGVTYAIWSGLGVVLITVFGAIYFKQVPDLPAIIGMLLIIAGVVVINLFSKTVGAE